MSSTIFRNHFKFRRMYLSFFFVLILNQSCFSWNLIRVKKSCDSFILNQVTIKKTIALGITLASLSFQPSIAISAVGEGDLPDGAMAFSKLLKYKSEWTKLAETVKTRLSSADDKIDEKEITGIKIFLKQLANEYYDMDLLSKSILGSEKVSRAKEIAKDFRSKIRQCDDSASNGDLNKIVEIYPLTNSEIQEFVDLMNDVPDEL